MEKEKINLLEVADVMDFQSEEGKHFLDPLTGEIIYKAHAEEDYHGGDSPNLYDEDEDKEEDPDLDLDEDENQDLIPIPTIDPAKPKKWMEEFARSVKNKNLSKKLLAIAQGKTPGKRFHDALRDNAAEQKKWKEIYTENIVQEARDWIEESHPDLMPTVE